MATSAIFGLLRPSNLRAFHAATLHHTAKRRLDHIQQPTDWRHMQHPIDWRPMDAAALLQSNTPCR